MTWVLLSFFALSARRPVLGKSMLACNSHSKECGNPCSKSFNWSANMAGGPRDLIVTLPLLLFLQLISGACERGDGDGTMHRYERAEGSRAWNEWVWLEMLSVLSWFRYHQEVSARNLRTLYLGCSHSASVLSENRSPHELYHST